MMSNAGYGDRKQQKKRFKEVFVKATKLAEQERGIKRTAEEWQKKFTRIKQEYSAFTTELAQTGRDRDDENFFQTPQYFELMPEIEEYKASHHPLAVCSTDAVGRLADSSLSTSRKKAKLSPI